MAQLYVGILLLLNTYMLCKNKVKMCHVLQAKVTRAEVS